MNKTLKKLTFLSGAIFCNLNANLKWKTQMENSVEKCRLFQIVRRTIRLTGRNATKSQQNTRKADISLRSNILQSQCKSQMENSNGKLKWKTQMENSVEMCRLFQIVRRTIRLTGRNATKSQQNTKKADISLRSNILQSQCKSQMENSNGKLKWKTQ
jgi:hypothetical protein